MLNQHLKLGLPVLCVIYSFGAGAGQHSKQRHLPNVSGKLPAALPEIAQHTDESTWQ
jgi:hypothetical protein